MNYAAVARLLTSSTDLVLTTHRNPDGDGLGAGCALALGLRRLGKRVRFIVPTPLVSTYRFLPGFADITLVADGSAAAAQTPTELLVSLDCGDRERLGACVAIAHGQLLNLDHHETNTRFGHQNLVDVRAESTGVMVWQLLRRLRVSIDRDLATCIYTTLTYDTGRFLHPNTTPRVHRIAAALMATGIDASLIERCLSYDRTPKDFAIQRLGLEHLAVDEDPRLAGIALAAADIAPLLPVEDWGDLVEFPRSLRGVEVAYLMRESADRATVRCSLRSNPPYAVGPVAERFGGGGHRQAAGCTFSGNLIEARREILPLLRAALAAG
jgi:phosphoesterase RecJ-like protein